MLLKRMIQDLADRIVHNQKTGKTDQKLIEELSKLKDRLKNG